MKTVLILGGMGFIGWPTSLKFLSEGYRVIVIDNLSRGDYKVADRQKADIIFEYFDIQKNPRLLKECFDNYSPDHVIHLAEQRSAPHSMMDRCHTVENNIIGTHNILNLLVGTNTNIVHIGSMGVYGYDGKQEGFNPGSIYHMTKCMDNQMFRYYNKNWNIVYSDLHQGIVWGWETSLTQEKNYGKNTFDYDGIYGTVFNRFCFQAANNLPLTIYGSGKRARAFIHLEDSVQALFDYATQQKTGTFNLFTEIHTISDLAEIISKRYNVDISYINNPRNELDENTLDMKSDYRGKNIINSDYMDSIVNSLRGIDYDKKLICNSPRW
jgi:UDP-sulfoquinovose synthase